MTEVLLVNSVYFKPTFGVAVLFVFEKKRLFVKYVFERVNVFSVSWSFSNLQKNVLDVFMLHFFYK